MEIVLAADSALDQCDIHALGKFLGVDQRPVDEVDGLSDGQISRSSMSRKDMWQPEQPSSQTVAIFFLLIVSPLPVLPLPTFEP